jgi:hypothetical protein
MNVMWNSQNGMASVIVSDVKTHLVGVILLIDNTNSSPDDVQTCTGSFAIITKDVESWTVVIDTDAGLFGVFCNLNP